MIEIPPLLAYVSPLILAGATLISISVATFPRMREILKTRIKENNQAASSGIFNAISDDIDLISSNQELQKVLSRIRITEYAVLLCLLLSELLIGIVFWSLTEGFSLVSNGNNNEMFFTVLSSETSVYGFKWLIISSYVLLFVAIVLIIFLHLQISNVDKPQYKKSPPHVSSSQQFDEMFSKVYSIATS